MDETTKSSDITLADLLAAFSLATDLGLGQPMSHLLRAWQIAVRLADRLGVSVDPPTLFYVAMLAWVGCVADAPEVAACRPPCSAAFAQPGKSSIGICATGPQYGTGRRHRQAGANGINRAD